MTWTTVFSDNFTRANAASLGNGWVDSGSTASIVSNQANFNSNLSVPWNTNIVLRPSGENLLDQRSVVTIPAGGLSGANNCSPAQIFRVQSAGNEYSFNYNSQTNGITIFKITGGTATQLATTATSPTYNSAHTYSLDASVVGTNPTTLTYTVTDTTSSTVIGTLTTTDSTSALQNIGQSGLYTFSSTTALFSSFTSYTDVAGGALTSGTATLNSTGNTAASVTVGVATGGTSPYTYQWYRSTTPSFTPGVGNIVTGATSLTLNDTGLTNGTAYYYKNVATDNVGATATSNQITATPTAPVAVNSTAFVFSPGNWKGDTGRGGSSYRQTWNPGAYARIRITASAAPSATLLISTTATGALIAYFVNGKLIAKGVAATGNIALSGLVANATNDILIVLDATTEAGRWNNGGNTLQIQGIQLDSGSSAGAAPVYSKWVMIVGDSITQGSLANAGTNSNIYDYSFTVGQALLNAGYDYCVSACGYNGWLRAGDSTGDVPAYYYVSGGTYNASLSRWNLIDSGVSLLDSNNQISAYGSVNTAPDAIYINMGTNESLQSSSTSDTQASVNQCLTALRGAAPNAKILVGIPFGLYNTAQFANGLSYVSAIKAGVASHSTDAKVLTADFGAPLSQYLASADYTYDGIHPLLIGHAIIAPLVMQTIQNAISPGTTVGRGGNKFMGLGI